jgi:hypothetical protein
MLIAQRSDKSLPFWRSRKARFFLAWIYFQQQSRAIQVAGIAGWSDDIRQERLLLYQIFSKSCVGFQALNILCIRVSAISNKGASKVKKGYLGKHQFKKDRHS